jgi:hypothetical protein
LVQLGETATLSIVFEGAQDIPDVALPEIPGARAGGPMRSSSTQIVNGKVSQQVSLQWTLVPTRTGDIVIGPWDLDVGGKKLAFPRMVLAVKARSDVAGAGEEALFARVSLPEKAPYLQQSFPVTLEIWALPEIRLGDGVRILGGLPEQGVKSDGFAALRETREEDGGRVYVVRRYRGEFRAQAAGEYRFAPVLEATVIQPGRRRDPFDDPFFSGFGGGLFGERGTPVLLAAEEASVAVRPVPEEGRPGDWSGGVGSFRFTAEARPREVAVGEPVTVTLRLEGNGNWESARVPSYGDTAAYKAYEPKLANDPGAEPGVKVYDQVVIPRSEALMELPALSFSWFDPESEGYRTATAGPFPVTVKAAAEGGRALVLTADGGGTGRAAGPTILGSDIQYLHPVDWRAGRRGGGGAAAWWAVHGAALAGLGVWWWVLRRRSRLVSDVAFARRLKAPRASRAHLRRAQELLGRGAGAEEVFAELNGAVTAYFGHRYNLPPGDATAGFITARLEEAGLDAESVAGFSEFFEVADRVRYASSALGGGDLGAWPGRVAALLRQAERVVR